MADEFEVALQLPATDAGAESAAITRRGATAAPAGDDPSLPPADSTTAQRDQRVISDSTRKAIARIAALGKQADTIDVADDLVPMEHEPGAAKPAPATAPAAKPSIAPAAAATQPAPAASHAPPIEQPAAHPPADAARAQATAAEIMARAEVDRLRADHDTRSKALEAREAAIAAREKALPDRTALAERPVDALEAFLRNALGLGEKDDAELKDALSDLITETSIKHFGVDPGPELRAKIESRKALRAVKAYKGDFQRQQQELTDQRAAAAKADQEAKEQREQAGREREAIQLVQRLTTEAKESHPFVHAAGELGLIEDPSAVVVELIRAQRQRGEPANFEAAIKLADDHFRPKVEAAVKKSASYSTLLNPAAKAAPAATTAAAVTGAPASQQVGDQVRRPTTLTTTPTAPANPDPSPDDGIETEDRYDRRHRSLRGIFAKHRSRFPSAEG